MRAAATERDRRLLPFLVDPSRILLGRDLIELGHRDGVGPYSGERDQGPKYPAVGRSALVESFGERGEDMGRLGERFARLARRKAAGSP